MLTVVTGGFWKDGPDAWDENMDESEIAQREEEDGEGENEESEYSGRQIDEVDIITARMALNGFLQKMGHAPAF